VEAVRLAGRRTRKRVPTKIPTVTRRGVPSDLTTPKEVGAVADQRPPLFEPSANALTLSYS